jgi:cytochrome oxidase Cu insertion factor (SCO1/SenC/PrrC family)
MFAPPETRHSRPAWTRWVLGLLAVALLTGASILFDFSRKSAGFEGVSGAVGPSVLANVELRDQRGQALSTQAFAGKTVVLNFMFTSCPSVCPLQARELARVQRAIPESLKSRVAFLSVSVDPERDTPEVLQRFASANGIDLGNWSLATASPEATRKLALELQAIEPSAGSALPAAHGTSVYLFDARGRLMQRYAGKPLDRQRLVREIEAISRMETGDRRTAAL